MLLLEPATSSSAETSPTDVISKERICQHITGSRYFFMIGRGPVNVRDRKLYKELESGYREILGKLFEKLSKREARRTYVNRIQETKVSIKVAERIDSISENAFLCIARNRVTQRIHEFYVSEEYNLNESSNWAQKRIVGRFVFVPLDNGMFSIRALAEQPAEAVSHNIEDFYQRVRESHEPAESVAEDPLCRLTKLERVRVCTSVLNSSYFRDQIRYSPKSDFIYGCKKMEVSFRTKDATAKAVGDSKYYEEWMLWCLAESLEPDAQTEYFVSRAYHSNNVFVYTRDYSSREMYLENLSSDISVVID